MKSGRRGNLRTMERIAKTIKGTKRNGGVRKGERTMPGPGKMTNAFRHCEEHQ
jgi:hypothetical protein